MKVIFYSHTEFADCTFPLIKELQDQGVDAYCYLEINRNFQSDNIIEFKNKVNWFGLYKASQLKEFETYKDCVNLNKVYIIAPFIARSWWLPGVVVWMYAIINMIRMKPDVLHIDWQLQKTAKLLRLLRVAKKNIMTVHDPIIHGNTPNWQKEDKNRIECFSWADHLILLNNEQVNEFSNKYNIPLSKISVSHLGAYDSISKFPIDCSPKSDNYVLFWGRINPYKGLEDLLEASKICKKKIKDYKLIVAGSGTDYMDFSPYKELDYIEWRHRYIGISELVNLIRNSKFAVCPYKDATQSGVVQTAFVLDKPVIATNVGALPKAVSDGITGYIVPPSNPVALADAIHRLWINPEIINDMTSNIRNIWRPTMKWDSIAKEYINIYNNA